MATSAARVIYPVMVSSQDTMPSLKKDKEFINFPMSPQHTLHLNILFLSQKFHKTALTNPHLYITGTNVPNSARRSDGYYTVGMQDINFQVPDNCIIGCAAKCGDTQYPDPQPGSDPVEIITRPL